MAFGDFSAVVNTTTNQFIRKAESGILRNRYILAKLASAGCIKKNCFGRKHEWKLRYKRAQMRTLSDGGVIIFPNQNYHKTLELEYRAYYVAGAISEFQREQNKNEAAILKLWSDEVGDRIDDIKDSFHEKIWQQDGYAANSKEIMGLPSAFGATANTSSIFGTNNDTYATKSTARAAFGGSFTGTFWPFGTATPQYDAHTPFVINYTSPLDFDSGGWESDVKTWPNTGVQALRTGNMCGQLHGDPLDSWHLEFNMFRQLLDAASADQRITVMRNQDPGITKLGFKAVNIDGVDVMWEAGIPSGVGYGLSFKNIELLSMYGQLFKSATDFDLDSSSNRVVIKFFGNLKLKKLNGLVQLKNVS